MNKYQCFYHHQNCKKEILVEAESSFEAREKAARYLAVKEQWKFKITPMLIEKDGVKVKDPLSVHL